MEIIWKVEDRIITGVGLLKKGETYKVSEELGKQLINQKLAKPVKKKKEAK